MKAATATFVFPVPISIFQSTPPVKAATIRFIVAYGVVVISIHAAREGGDSPSYSPRLSVHISIHAAREGGDPFYCLYVTTGVISIHAAREGGDCFVKSANILTFISIHAAREGGDFHAL